MGRGGDADTGMSAGSCPRQKGMEAVLAGMHGVGPAPTAVDCPAVVLAADQHPEAPLHSPAGRSPEAPHPLYRAPPLQLPPFVPQQVCQTSLCTCAPSWSAGSGNASVACLDLVPMSIL